MEHIDRAANDTTVCSLTGNIIIPQGQPGFTPTQRDTCYGAYLRQLVANPFVGLIREGALSTPMVQRALLLVRFPQYTSANRRGYFGESRYNALQVSADKRFDNGALIGANYTFSRSYGNVETVTSWLDGAAGNPVAGYQTNDLEQEMALSSFDVRTGSSSFVVDLPFGEGRRYGRERADLPGADQRVDPDGVTTLQSGFRSH